MRAKRQIKAQSCRETYGQPIASMKPPARVVSGYTPKTEQVTQRRLRTSISASDANSHNSLTLLKTAGYHQRSVGQDDRIHKIVVRVMAISHQARVTIALHQQRLFAPMLHLAVGKTRRCVRYGPKTPHGIWAGLPVSASIGLNRLSNAGD